MPKATVQVRILNRALEFAGGLRELSKVLQMPVEELEIWLSGSQLPPTWVFLKAVDYVNAEERDLPKAM